MSQYGPSVVCTIQLQQTHYQVTTSVDKTIYIDEAPRQAC